MRKLTLRGFTLVELLVVVSVVAVLASLLLPALGRAKSKTRQTNCLNNSRQLSLGIMMYVDDNRSTFPPSADYGLPTSIPERIWTMKVISYLQESNVFHCPAAATRKFPANWDERGVGSVGYTTGTAFDPAGVEGFTSFTTESMFESPALAPLFGDTPGGQTSDKYRGFTFDPYNGDANTVDARLGTPLIADRDLVPELNSLPPSALKPLWARHSGRVILILADGHASAYATGAILAQEKGARLHWRFRTRP